MQMPLCNQVVQKTQRVGRRAYRLPIKMGIVVAKALGVEAKSIEARTAEAHQCRIRQVGSRVWSVGNVVAIRRRSDEDLTDCGDPISL